MQRRGVLLVMSDSVFAGNYLFDGSVNSSDQLSGFRADPMNLIAAACNDASRRVEQTQAEKMASFTGGFNLPLGG